MNILPGQFPKGGLSLKGGVKKSPMSVSFKYKINKAIAEIALAVKKNNNLFRSYFKTSLLYTELS